ncbi:hypothetical protein BVRB_9g216230 isoform B [Beta vulgaris subsp. vulgaris]|nr:hypothetical protein BVRB_9g216230 isoform B [Beta vulgaris subsp. vulgaris]
MSKSEIDYECNSDEALNSPFSRVYLCPETEQIINCAMGLKYPIDVEALKNAFSNSIVKHPRFCSLVVIRNPNGGEHWKRTHVNIDDHFILHHTTTTNTNDLNDDVEDEEAAVNAYLADIAVSTPLSKNKPLWEVHVLMELKCVVLRVHHTLGDGVSLMSMLSACFGQRKEIKCNVNGDKNVKEYSHEKRKWKVRGIWGLLKSLWLTLVFGLRLLGRILWVKDEKSLFSGGDGIELWPRKVITANFKVEDFKSIKKVIPNVTVNDVLLGLISYGLAKYVDVNSPEAMRQNLEVTAILVVNLRGNHCKQLSITLSILTLFLSPKMAIFTLSILTLSILSFNHC